jgi:tRNA threonylcarbamoyladenosine biosynthesis protein TsaB
VKVLALSTSTRRGSVAIVRPGSVTMLDYIDLQGHAERLFASIDSVLAKAGESRGTLQGIACDIGPGSFTGVRVGVASAKGIALGLGIPLAPVVSLEAMAAAAFGEGAADAHDVVVAALDARKGEVFVAAYDAHGAARVAPCARTLGQGALRTVQPDGGGRVVAVGEAVEDIPLIEGVVRARGPALDLPDAAWIGRLAMSRFGGGLDADAVLPLYVRPPDVTPPRPKSSGSG